MEISVGEISKLLKSLLAYTTQEIDLDLIQMAIEDRTDYVLSYCNRNDIPKRLATQLKRMILGEFLYLKKMFFGSESLGLETLALISSIVEDDTTVSFDNNGETSDEANLDAFINRWRNGNRVTLQEYRRLKW